MKKHRKLIFEDETYMSYRHGETPKEKCHGETPTGNAKEKLAINSTKKLAME